jgi:DNA-binding CsgD family transcriptional regulator
MDRARGRLRRDDPETALKIWWALLRGRWSMVEWFDTDRRRYILAVPNAPRVLDPRGLTNRECQVVAYAALGESKKLIAYRLGISGPRTSEALRSAMRKLCVKTQAQLVEKLHTLGAEQPPQSQRPGRSPKAESTANAANP